MTKPCQLSRKFCNSPVRNYPMSSFTPFFPIQSKFPDLQIKQDLNQQRNYNDPDVFCFRIRCYIRWNQSVRFLQSTENPPRRWDFSCFGTDFAPTNFLFMKDDYYASVCGFISQLNCQIILLLKPLLSTFEHPINLKDLKHLEGLNFTIRLYLCFYFLKQIWHSFPMKALHYGVISK